MTKFTKVMSIVLNIFAGFCSFISIIYILGLLPIYDCGHHIIRYDCPAFELHPLAIFMAMLAIAVFYYINFTPTRRENDKIY